MRLLFIIWSILQLYSCKEKSSPVVDSQPWSEEQKRKYFDDSISEYGTFWKSHVDDTVSKFTRFFQTHYPGIKAKNWNDPFPYVFKEEYVDTTRIDSSKRWFRLMVNPLFRTPYCFVLEKRSNQSILITKMTNGLGGQNTGRLVFDMELPAKDSLFNYVFNELDNLSFWSLPGQDTSCLRGYAGEAWIFEAIQDGKYNYIIRWGPDKCGNDTSRTLGKIAKALNDFSRLNKIQELLKSIPHTDNSKIAISANIQGSH
jgi:hypothetical protein